MTPAIYVQTNDASDNEIVAFSRSEEGQLAPLGRFSTGGRGTGEPHLPSQNSIVLSDDAQWLLVTNSGSDDLSLFAIESGGLRLEDRVESGGNTPTSVAVSGDLVYVLNNGTPCITGFNLSNGKLTPLEDSTRQLSADDADPAQISFSVDGAALIATERGHEQHQQLCDRRARLCGRADHDRVQGPDAVRLRLHAEGLADRHRGVRRRCWRGGCFLVCRCRRGRAHARSAARLATPAARSAGPR